MDATPTPSPPINRYIISSVCEADKAQPMADNENRKPDSINEVFLPNRSESSPAKATPIIQPTNAELTNQPSITLSRANLDFTKPMVPDITAVSYPKRNPPKAAVSVMKKRYFEFVVELSFIILPGKLIINKLKGFFHYYHHDNDKFYDFYYRDDLSGEPGPY